jgi:hypothetical protein
MKSLAIIILAAGVLTGCKDDSHTLWATPDHPIGEPSPPPQRHATYLTGERCNEARLTLLIAGGVSQAWCE